MRAIFGEINMWKKILKGKDWKPKEGGHHLDDARSFANAFSNYPDEPELGNKTEILGGIADNMTLLRKKIANIPIYDNLDLKSKMVLAKVSDALQNALKRLD